MTPTADSRAIVAAAIRIFERIWKEGFAWRKAGVLLLDLSSADDIQPTLFTDQVSNSDGLMKAVDRINDRLSNRIQLRPLFASNNDPLSACKCAPLTEP